MVSWRGIVPLAVLAMAASSFAQLQAITYVSGLSQPVAMIQDPTRPDTQYVVQRGGLIRVVQNGVLRATNFLNISTLTTTAGERGLLCLAFAPDYATSGFAYIYYTDTSGNIQIRRYTRSSADPFVLDATTALNIINVAHPGQDNHNGGCLAFGPDNLLYAAFGDGGAGNDPFNNAQNPNQLLGKMIRIDPTVDDFPADPNRNYRIPATNPFLDGIPITAMGEIWAFGYRNPFRFSFDDPARGGNGGLIVGDVGQDAWEEIDYEPMGQGGRNYGWRQREGAHNTGLGGSVAFTPTMNPIFEYFHTNGDSMAITGGYIYRGGGPGLGAAFQGRYFFADEVTAKVWSLNLAYNGSGEATASDLQEHTASLGATAIGAPASFAVDANGDIYIVNLAGGRVSLIASTTRNLTGHVTLGDYGGPVAGQTVNVEVRTPGTTTVLNTYTPTLDAGGNFSVAITRVGSYDVSVKKSHWLRKTTAFVSFGAGGASFSASLVNGDINGDNAVTLGDFAALRSAFGSSVGDPNFNANADLNGDGSVTLGDFAILRAHFGQSGDN